MSSLNYVSISELIEKYDTLLFDSYGVLVDQNNCLPHAAELINHLNQINKDYLVVTNNASDIQARICEKMHKKGLHVPEERLVSSGLILKPWLEENGLDRGLCLFMGNKESHGLLKGTDCEILDLENFDLKSKTLVDSIIICTQPGKHYRENVEKLISYVFFCLDQGKMPKIVVPNPDMIFPKDTGTFGIVSGMVVLMLEAAVKLRYPSRSNLSVSYLGKPNPYIFEKAAERFSGGKVIMIGDQMETDIRGAYHAKLDSGLISGGVVDEEYLEKNHDFLPTYLLKNLSL